MHIKSIVAGAAIAFAVGMGSASAADQFDTLRGVPVVALSSITMDTVIGSGSINVSILGTPRVENQGIPTGPQPEPNVTVILTGAGDEPDISVGPAG